MVIRNSNTIQSEINKKSKIVIIEEKDIEDYEQKFSLGEPVFVKIIRNFTNNFGK
jgi:hypothetical protein